MTFLSAGAGVTGTGTSAAVPVPSGIAANVIVTVAVYVENATDATAVFTSGAAAGFALVPLTAGGTADTGITNGALRGRLLNFWKRASAADTGTYSFTWTTSSPYEAVAVAHTGINRWMSNPWEQTIQGIAGSSTATTTTPSITTGIYTTDLVGFCTSHATNAGAWTPPSGMTERYDNSGSGTAHLTADSQDAAAAGVQAKTFTGTGNTGNTYYRSFLGSLIPETIIMERAHTSQAPAGTASYTVTLPTHDTNDLLLHVTGGKYDTTSVATIDQGWTLIKSGTGGTGVTGNDSGTNFTFVYAKIAGSASETAPVVTAGGTAPNSWVGWTFSLVLGQGMAWKDAIGSNVDWVQMASDATTASPMTGTPTAFTGQPTANDALLAFFASPTDSHSGVTAGSITGTGLADGLAATTSGKQLANALNNDCDVTYWPLYGFSGTLSGSPTASVTYNTTSTISNGVVTVIAIRQDFPAATGSGSLDLTGSGAMSADTAAAGSLSLSGSGTAENPGAAVGAASLSFSGAGALVGANDAAGSLSLSGVGSTSADTGSATGTLSLSGTGTAGNGYTGIAAIDFTGSGVSVAAFSGSGSFSLTGADNAISSGAIAVAAINFSGTWIVPDPVCISQTLHVKVSNTAITEHGRFWHATPRPFGAGRLKVAIDGSNTWKYFDPLPGENAGVGVGKVLTEDGWIPVTTFCSPYLTRFAGGPLTGGFSIYTRGVLPSGAADEDVILGYSSSGLFGMKIETDGTLTYGTPTAVLDPDSNGSSIIGPYETNGPGYLTTDRNNGSPSIDYRVRKYVIDATTLATTLQHTETITRTLPFTFTPEMSPLASLAITMEDHTSGQTVHELSLINITFGGLTLITSTLDSTGLSGFDAGSILPISDTQYYTSNSRYFEVDAAGTVIVDISSNATLDTLWSNYGFDSFGCVAGLFFATAGPGGDQLVQVDSGGTATNAPISDYVFDPDNNFTLETWSAGTLWSVGGTTYMSAVNSDLSIGCVTVDPLGVSPITYFMQDPGNDTIPIGITSRGEILTSTSTGTEYAIFTV